MRQNAPLGGLHRPDRVFRVFVGVAARKTSYQLAQELGCQPVDIRRHIDQLARAAMGHPQPQNSAGYGLVIRPEQHGTIVAAVSHDLDRRLLGFEVVKPSQVPVVQKRLIKSHGAQFKTNAPDDVAWLDQQLPPVRGLAPTLSGWAQRLWVILAWSNRWDLAEG
ncbi:hypothetical protein ACFCQI_02855 [Rhodanobacter sp. FW102-FHT14D06]|uniref:Uncharacterized protein n=2 Tax=unclassified Rhodanobacter TaxID=2621553 RepID=A0AB74UWT8_9GAMM